MAFEAQPATTANLAGSAKRSYPRRRKGSAAERISDDEDVGLMQRLALSTGAHRKEDDPEDEYGT